MNMSKKDREALFRVAELIAINPSLDVLGSIKDLAELAVDGYDFSTSFPKREGGIDLNQLFIEEFTNIKRKSKYD